MLVLVAIAGIVVRVMIVLVLLVPVALLLVVLLVDMVWMEGVHIEPIAWELVSVIITTIKWGWLDDGIMVVMVGAIAVLVVGVIVLQGQIGVGSWSRCPWCIEPILWHWPEHGRVGDEIDRLPGSAPGWLLRCCLQRAQRFRLPIDIFNVEREYKLEMSKESVLMRVAELIDKEMIYIIKDIYLKEWDGYLQEVPVNLPLWTCPP